MFLFSHVSSSPVTEHTPTSTYTPTDKLLDQLRVQIAYLFHAFELNPFTQSLLMVNKTTVYTDISLYLQDPNFLIAWTTPLALMVQIECT